MPSLSDFPEKVYLVRRIAGAVPYVVFDSHTASLNEESQPYFSASLVEELVEAVASVLGESAELIVRGTPPPEAMRPTLERLAAAYAPFDVDDRSSLGVKG